MELHFGTYREMITEDQNEIKSLSKKGNEANNNLVEDQTVVLLEGSKENLPVLFIFI